MNRTVESMTDSNSDWSLAAGELVATIKDLGFPEELGRQVARQLGGIGAIKRMTAYLCYERPKKAEIIVDEMLAICSDIDRWKQKKIAEEANEKYNELLYYGLGTEEEDCEEQ